MRNEIARSADLLDFGFLVDHMLADDGIELLDLHFIRHGALVLGSSVEMTCSGAGNQFDFISHSVFLWLIRNNA